VIRKTLNYFIYRFFENQVYKKININKPVEKQAKENPAKTG